MAQGKRTWDNQVGFQGQDGIAAHVGCYYSKSAVYLKMQSAYAYWGNSFLVAISVIVSNLALYYVRKAPNVPIIGVRFLNTIEVITWYQIKLTLIPPSRLNQLYQLNQPNQLK